MGCHWTKYDNKLAIIVVRYIALKLPAPPMLIKALPVLSLLNVSTEIILPVRIPPTPAMNVTDAAFSGETISENGNAISPM